MGFGLYQSVLLCTWECFVTLIAFWLFVRVCFCIFENALLLSWLSSSSLSGCVIVDLRTHCFVALVGFWQGMLLFIWERFATLICYGPLVRVCFGLFDTVVWLRLASGPKFKVVAWSVWKCIVTLVGFGSSFDYVFVDVSAPSGFGPFVRICYCLFQNAFATPYAFGLFVGVCYCLLENAM